MLKKKYKPQADAIIAELINKIDTIRLAEAICEYRYMNGIDRVPLDIHIVIRYITKELGGSPVEDTASLFGMGVRQDYFL